MEYADYDDETSPGDVVEPVRPSRSALRRWGPPVATVCAFVLSGVAFTMAWRIHETRPLSSGETTLATQTETPPRNAAPSRAPGYLVVPVPTSGAADDVESNTAPRKARAANRVSTAVSRRADKEAGADPGVLAMDSNLAAAVAASTPPAPETQPSALEPPAHQAQVAGKNGAPIIDNEGPIPVADVAAQAEAPEAAKHPAPLRGVVWSPSEQRLVPAESASSTVTSADPAE
ncbi:MAG: hypothetical protein ABUS79_20245 [Pseudomonadota bacterium]